MKREIVQGIRDLLDAFNVKGPVPIISPGRLQDSLERLQDGPRLGTDYLMLAFASVTIRWAAHETGRGEIEILEEVARGFGVT